MPNHKKILIVEDDHDINRMLSELLTKNAYDASSAFSGTEAVMCLERQRYDLIILDIMLPGMDGHEVMTHIHAGTPVIILSAIDAIEQKIGLLKSGAVDYITKPFDNRELLARIEAHLRSNMTAPSVLTHGDIVMDIDNYEVTVHNTPVQLTKMEYSILKLLMEYPSKVFTKTNIYRSVWGDDYLGDDNTINVHISKLRTKLQKSGAQTEYIQTVWGIGFKMQEN